MNYSIVGKSIPQREALDKVIGQAKYLDDIELPGMLHAKMLRSKHPHAKLSPLNVAEAEKAHGVFAIITARDVPLNRRGVYAPPVFAEEKVRFVGEPIAAVAAESEEEAEDALELIRLDYEELPAVFDPMEALQPNSVKLFEQGNISSRRRIISGNIEDGFKQSDEIVEEEFTTQKIQHCNLEPHGAIAVVDVHGRLTVWSAPGTWYQVYQQLLNSLKLSTTNIRFLRPYQGGGFGAKNHMTVEPYVSLLALKTKRPVKMVWNREEEFTAAGTRLACFLRYKTGVKKDGTMLAREINAVYETGAYTVTQQRILDKGAMVAAGPYRIPNIRIEGCMVHTNKNLGVATRGFGVPQVMFAEEAHTDSIAQRLGMDPLELRLKNAFRSGDKTATGTILNRVGIRETILSAAKAAQWKLREEQP